jgi:hypothetical protein
MSWLPFRKASKAAGSERAAIVVDGGRKGGRARSRLAILSNGTTRTVGEVRKTRRSVRQLGAGAGALSGGRSVRLLLTKRVDRYAAAADLACGEWIIRVAPHERGQVEGGREAGLRLAMFRVREEVLEALVRVIGRAEAGELSHGPEAFAIHLGVDAARVGERPRSSNARESVARALGGLHAEQKLWQDPRGRLCVRGSAFAAKPRRSASRMETSRQE